ncbi:hypothetical protein KM043_006600 [Ampulex compressa]|nr:hypothetical protein KM043_006600 [Ampulex compressa]
MKSIPERWLEYVPYGKVINGTKLLAFKVPLKQQVNQNLQPDQRFAVAQLLKAFPGLKCIVDLTNTTRYYNSKEFTNADVKYKKLMTPGREIPSSKSFHEFVTVIEDFSSVCGTDELIGVHCTHGVNRTGYLICRYLIQQLGWEVEESLKAFQDARGYPIERQPYLDALRAAPRGVKIDTSKMSIPPPLLCDSRRKPGVRIMPPPMPGPRMFHRTPRVFEPTIRPPVQLPRPYFAYPRLRLAPESPWFLNHTNFAPPRPPFLKPTSSRSSLKKKDRGPRDKPRRKQDFTVDTFEENLLADGSKQALPHKTMPTIGL